VAGEEEQQIELALRERDLLAGDEHAAGGGVDLELGDAQRRLGAVLVGLVAAQHGIDAGDELGGGEGLDDVVVGAEAQAVDAVGLVAPGGEEDDRDARTRALPQQPHDLEPVETGQHEVEHDEVWVPGRDAGEGGVPVAGDARVVVRALEVARHDLRDRRLIVDDEHPSARLAGHLLMIAARRAREKRWSCHWGERTAQVLQKCERGYVCARGSGHNF
jgi:hypothetical protein